MQFLLNSLNRLESLLQPEASGTSQARKIFAECGLTSIFVYLIFWIYFQNFYFHWLRSSRNLSNLVLLPGLMILLFVYWRGYKILKEHPAVGIRPMLVFGAIAAVFAVLTPSFYSSDLLTYINYGWQQARYHANPYCLLIAGTEGFGKDPMFTAVWTLNPSPYGFAFLHLSRIICQLGGGNLPLTIQLFKLVNFVGWSALGAVIYFGGRRFKIERPDLSLYLYLWSPLILIHTLSGGHNDALMTLLVMSSFWSAACNIVAAPIALLVTGVLIKYVWAFALPFLLLYLLRKSGWKVTIANVLAGIVTLVCLALNYKCKLEEVRWYEMAHNLTANTNSLPAVIQSTGNALQLLLFHGTSAQGDLLIANGCAAAKLMLLASFVVFAAYLFYRAIRSKEHYSLPEALQYCVLGVMSAVCLVSAKFYPWYVVMFFPAALWLPERSETRRLALTLSCTQLFAVTFLGHGHTNNFLLLTALPFAIFAWRWRRLKFAPVQATKGEIESDLAVSAKA